MRSDKTQCLRMQAAQTMTDSPSPDLMSAISESALIVLQFHRQAALAPTQSEVSDRLEKFAKAADLLGRGLESADHSTLAGLSPGELLLRVVNHWVRPSGMIVNPRGFRAMSAGLRTMCSQITEARGGVRMSDIMQIPGGEETCALASSMLFQAVRGKKGGSSNPKLLSLCAKIWELATGTVKPGQQGEDNNDEAWRRHLRTIDKWIKGTLPDYKMVTLDAAQTFVQAILQRFGLKPADWSGS
jgi:hypothetical protein